MHFYTQTATGIEPRHFVENKSGGGLRPSRQSDARAALKRGETWVSSVTTILGVLDKPALLNWKIDKHLETAFLMDVHKYGAEEFARECKRLTADALDAAPKAGTDFHKVMEDCFNSGNLPENPTEAKAATAIIKKIHDVCGDVQIECEKYFIGDGYAGCADLVVGDWVIDYKTKQTADKFKPGKMVYAEHTRQLAAYAKALGKPKAANIFICLENGEIDFHIHALDSLVDGWLDFEACIGIFNRSKS